MFFNKEHLERMRKEGEDFAKKLQGGKEKGKRYVSAAELSIRCLHCGHDRFFEGKALLNTRGLSFLDLDWLNDDAITLQCDTCGFIHWFGRKVKVLSDDE
jgi:predicted nucleic-acid-binding Zn-ribbon protein